MKTIAALGALVVLALATAEAKMTCEKSSEPAKLAYQNMVSVETTKLGPKYEAMFVKETRDEKAYLRIGYGTSDEKYAFYACSGAPEGFEQSNKQIQRGQVRSTKNPDQCLTIQKVDNGVTKGKKNGLNPKNTLMTMEKCDEENPRRQWWEKIGHSLTFEGKEGDTARDHVELADEGKLYMSDFSQYVWEPKLGSNRPRLVMA